MVTRACAWSPGTPCAPAPSRTMRSLASVPGAMLLVVAPACVYPSMVSGWLMMGSPEWGAMVLTLLLPEWMAKRMRSGAASALASAMAARSVQSVVADEAVVSQTWSPTERSPWSPTEVTT